ncbi:MAG: Rpn family recombination-promoting nuclease/putative transposase [Nannocystales bacterium]
MTKTPHDALFKSVFQQPENAAAELQHVLSAEHVSAIDWSTLKLEPGSYVDEKLADQHSDLLFSANAQASGERVLVYLLFEHQSTPEPKMALRLLSYMVSIWERFSDDDKNKALPLPLIVPAVLSQVVGGWKAATRFSELFSPNLGALADAVLPDFSYAVDDLHRTDDANLRARGVAQQARLALWLMRDARDGALLLRRLVDWLGELEELAQTPGGERALAPLLSYVVRVSSDLQLEEFRAILKERAPAAESITMTIAEQLLAEGEARGAAQGELRRAAASVLTVLDARGLVVAPDVRRRVEECSELEVLQDWLVRAATVAVVDEVFEG